MSKKPKYTLAELLAKCDYSAPLSPEDREWLDAPAVGREIGSGEYEEDQPPPDLKEIFEQLDKAGLPEGFLSPEDRDNGPAQERPELDKMFDALEDPQEPHDALPDLSSPQPRGRVS